VAGTVGAVLRRVPVVLAARLSPAELQVHSAT